MPVPELTPVSAAALERRFDRHFARQHTQTDARCAGVGPLLFSGLLVTLVPHRRWDLSAMVAVCAVESGLLRVLARQAGERYLRHRDLILFLHLLFHAMAGGHLQQVLNIKGASNAEGPVAFLLSFWFTTSVVWHAVNGFAYCLRPKRAMLYRPLVMLAAAWFEAGMCSQACRRAPDKAHYFQHAAAGVRAVFSAILPCHELTVARATSAASEQAGAERSCFKLQCLLLAVFGVVLPGTILYTWEQQELMRFKSSAGLVLVPDEEAKAYADLQAQLDAASEALAASTFGIEEASTQPGSLDSPRGAAAGTASPPCTSAPQQAQQAQPGQCSRDAVSARLVLHWRYCDLQRQQAEVQARLQQQWQRARLEAGGAAAGGRAPRLAYNWAPLLVVAVIWHALDTAL